MSHSSVSSDDEAPEAVSFNSEKKAAKSRNALIEHFHVEEKLKLKQKNRQRDKVLKERAASRRKPDVVGEGNVIVSEDESQDEGEELSVDPSREDLEARMERAMREAAEQSESDLSGGEDESDRFSDSPEAEDFSEDGGSGLDENENSQDEGEGSEDEDQGSSDEEDVPPPQKKSKRLDYLPDHLFSAAFAQAEPTTSSKRKAPSLKDIRPVKKRRRVKHATKDLVVGSRTIRTVTQTSDPSTSLPFSKQIRTTALANKFVKRNLNVHGKAQLSKTKGWERRPANLGVMRRNGPAANFFRAS